MDEKIKATIHKIKLLAQQNPEFAQEMQKMFGGTTSVVHNNYEARIAHIEKYLGLDYYVDSMRSSVDYSFIQETDVKAQLISDNREMLRFRYGTRYHEIIFEEFCRYAQLQAEMLLNYFYYHKEPTIKEMIAHIKKYNPNAEINDKISTLVSISFNTKLWAVCSEFQLKNVRTTFDYIREVRNNQSHRNPNLEDFSIEEYQTELRESNIIQLKKDGSVDWTYIKNLKQENLASYNIYETKIKKSQKFKFYNYLMWLNKKPFDEIIERLQELVNCVKNNI